MPMPRLYLSNSSIQLIRQSSKQLFNVPSWTWTAAFNWGHHWSTIRITQQVHLHASQDLKLQISLSDSSHRIAGYSCQLFNVSGAFAGSRLSSWLHISLATRSIFCSIPSPRPSATGLPRDRVCCVNLAQKISDITDCSLLVRKLFTAPSLFLTKEFKRQFIFVCDVIMTLHCVYCKTGSFHLLGSIYGILEIFAQNLHTYHRNVSTSACIMHFIYILV